LTPNESSKNIEGNIKQKINKMLKNKCTEHNMYNLGNIELLYRPDCGRIDALRPIQAYTIYHAFYQANGLSFSVSDNEKIPPSLRNIFKEIQNDIGQITLENGNLKPWAKQGVLLLNAILTVRASKAASHRNKGWEQFTDTVIRLISEEKEQVVFLFWGNYAQQKGKIVDDSKHLVLKSAHPSPLSAKLFFGNQHFSQANQYLEKWGKTPIDW
jgi:uracil-DNA glycosylase